MSSGAAAIGLGRSRLRSLWTRWSSSTAETWSRRLVLAAATALFLDSAATLQVGYTLTLSYLFLGAACLVGAPFVLRGWQVLPAVVRVFALGLLATYVVVLLTGEQSSVGGFSRAGEQRGLVYLADLFLGLLIVGLIAGLWIERSVRPLVIAFSIGAFMAGTYAAYQWFALRFNLPLGDLNNTLDSNGVTQGKSQGAGLFGGERVRGTFLEPHFLASYLAAALPLALVSARWLHGLRRRLAATGIAAMLVALILTISGPGWGIVALTLPLATVTLIIGRGQIAPAAGVGAITIMLWLSVVPVLASPALIAPLVGRSANDLAYSASYRTRTWEAALDVWSERPIIGAGPGQSSVRLTTAGVLTTPPRALISAQGIWAAALIDGGLIAFAMWLGLLGSIVVVGARSLVCRPDALRWAVLAAAFASVLAVLTSGDRVFPREWVLLALPLAGALGGSRSA